jgi:hypothetical protein
MILWTSHSNPQIVPPVAVSYTPSEEKVEAMDLFRQEIRNEIREMMSKLGAGDKGKEGAVAMTTTMGEVILL